MLVTHLRARVELNRHPHLKDRPVLIIDRSRGRPLVADRFPAAAGVSAGMTLEQARSRQAGSALLEADEPAYRRVFHRMLASLQGVSDRVEAGEPGTAYARLDGLEDLYGGEARAVNALLNSVPQHLEPRAGVADAKFPALVAARAASPLGAVRVPPDAAAFLAPHPVDLLPIAAAVRADLRRFGLHTLGDVASMKPEALAGRFGPAGRRAWELSHGVDPSPVLPIRQEESVVEHASLPFSSASLELILAAVDTLLRRAYSQPRMRGRYAGAAALECVLYRAVPWEKTFHFRQPVGRWERASRIIRGGLEPDHPQAPVEEVTLGLSRITGESGTQLSLLPDVREGLERRLVAADRELQARMDGHPALYRVVQVAPWHPAPEMRALQVPIDALGRDAMKPLLQPAPLEVREGPERRPAELLLERRWRRVERIEDTWSFDLWWMPVPLDRTYHRVLREDGGEVTLFLDRRRDRWYRQAS